MKQLVSALSLFVLLALPAQAQFTQSASFEFGSGRSIAVGDLNGDTHQDIFVAVEGGVNSVWLGDSNGNLTPLAQPNFVTGTTIDVALGDLDGDGDLDAVTVNAYPNNFNCNTYTCEDNRVWFNDGSGVFTLQWADGIQGGSQDVNIVDVTGDGWLDIVVANTSGPVQSQVYVSGGVVSTVFLNFTATSLGVQSSEVEVFDFAGSALPDFVFVDGFTGASSTTLENTTAAGTFSFAAGAGFGPRPFNPNGLVATDLNNDGDLDLVVGSSAPFSDNGGTHFLHSYLNNGDGTFSAPIQSGSDGEVRFDITAGDVDGDGNQDVLVGGYRWGYGGPFNAIAYGDGTGAFPEVASSPSGNRHTTAADMNKDGRLDIIAGNAGASNALFLNDGLTRDSFVVVNTNDGGPGSLRSAINYANDQPNGGGPDVISFNIPGASTTHTIFLGTELPVIADPVVIDATSQGDATCGSFGFGDRVLRVVLGGSALNTGGDVGFDVTAGNSTITGFVVQQFPQHGIRLGSNDNVITCNYVGTDADGRGSSGANGRIFTGAGVFIEGSNNDVRENIVVASSYDEIRVETGTTNTIEDNYAGVDVDVTVQISPHTTPNPGNENRIGIVSGASGVVEGNLVGGFFEGILLSQDGTATNNRIGIGPGDESLPSTRGINMFGNNGTAGPGNVISNNGVGILVQPGANGNQITQNSIFSNGADGIQLGAGSNGGILPLSWGAVYIDASGELTINVTAARNGTVELFKADSQGSGEGETFVSNLIPYSTAGSEQLFNLGDASALGVSVGDILVATLTDGTDNTSVFSATIPVASDPLVVLNTNDSGAGSLRAAIDFANATPNGGSPDEITFNIPGPGPHTIAPTSALPGMSEAVIINGYSQPGSSTNTTAAFQPFDADIRIYIDGSGQGSGNGLTVSGHSGSEIRGLVIYGAPGRAIDLAGGGHKVKGSYIGHDGVTYLGTGGIRLAGGADDEIGGPNPADRNIIMGGVGQEPSVTSPLIQGNYFGLKANGTEIYTTGRTTHSISSNQATFVEVRDNVMAGATWRDLSITHANAAQGPRNWSVINNRIGTDYTGTTTLPSGSNGIYVQKGAHDNLFQQNIIAGHSGSGILITQGDGDFSPLRNQIRQNSMFGNGNPGINLVAHNGVGPGAGTDANDGIGTPVIGDARISLDGHLVIPVSGGRDGTLEFFEADAQGQEGQRYFDQSALSGGFAVVVITDLAATGIEQGDFLIATLTDGVGNTSEFSVAVQVRQESLTVTSTADAGPGSFREAINTANATANGAGPDVITFDIPGPGPHVIQITSPLPALFDPVVIDGGDVCGGSVAEHNFDVVLQGDINSGGAAENGLVFVSSAGGSTVKGLVIHSFPFAGIVLDDADDMTISCNAIGVDADLVTTRDNGGEAVDALTGTERLTLGGPSESDGNILAGSRGGKNVSVFGGSQNVVENNWIGVSPVSGAALNPNVGVYEIGIGIGSGSQNILRSNVVGGASLQGIEVLAAETTATITENFVGVTPTGSAVPNGAGVVFQAASTTNVVFRNTISSNSGAGVRVDDFASNENTISENTMSSNGAGGIQLNNGGNDGSSIPDLASAVRQASNLGFVSVSFDAPMPNGADVEFFLADATSSQGETFLGRQFVGAGTTSLDISYSGAIEAGDVLIATATDADGSTSAFSGTAIVQQAQDATILADQIIVIGDVLDFQISTAVSGIPGMEQAIQAAFAAWNQVPTALTSTKINLLGGTTSTTEPALQDGVNLITQSSDAFPLSVNTLAVASKLLAVAPSGDARILSADIVFNRDLLANPDEGLGTDANPGIWDVQAVAMHEIGHVMGLRHSGIASSTMFFSIPSGKSYRSLEVDDRAWVSHRYPSASAASLGSIAGNVADGEGAVAGGLLGGVLVVARNTATGGRIHAYSDENGDFLIPGVPAGDYEISIQPLDGFVDNIPGMVPGTVSPYLASITEYAQFSEEMWSGVNESGLEATDVAAIVTVAPGQDVSGIDFTTNLDNVAPTVNGASPSNNATDVRIRPSISVTFSEPVQSPATSALAITLEPVAGGPALSGIVQVPNAPSVVGTFDLTAGTQLDYFTAYRMTVTGATDEKGNVQGAPFTSTFTTRPEDQVAPNLLTTTPAANGVNVAPNTSIALSFDEPMDFDSIENGVTICVLDGGTTCGMDVAGTWSFPRTSLAEALPQWVAVFTPDAMLAESATYRVEVASTVRDQAAGGGNVIGTVAPIEFDTVPDQNPTRVDFGPAENSSNQSVRLSVFADFSEPMVLPEVNGTNGGVTVTGQNSGNVAGTVEVLNDGKRIVFRPDAPLAFFDSFTASFSSQITDATGNAIQGFNIPFQTAAQPGAVEVTTVSPLVAIPGSIVVFSGEGFNANPALNSILFTGASGSTVPGEIKSSTLSTLTAVVPDGAISGDVTITSGGQSGSISLELYNVIPLVDPAVARKTAESAPRDVEVTPDGGSALVTNSGAGSVSILNVETGEVRARVTVGDSPLKVAINPKGTRAYVTNFGSNEISVLDISDVNAPTLIKNIPVGLNPFGLAVSPDGKRLYVAEYTSKKITIIDIEADSPSADRAIARIGVEINERNVEEEPDGGTRKIGVDSNPRDIEVSPDGGSLFFTTETLGLRVLLLDENGSADEDAATRRITRESSTRDVELSPDGGLVFVTTLEGALEAYRIPPDLNSTSSFQAVARLGRESNSREVEVSPDGGLIYVTNFEQGLVQVYSITSLYTPSANSATAGFTLSFEPVTAYSVGENPEAVVFSAAAQVALVANSGSNDVTVISFENEINTITDSDGDGLGDDEEGGLGTDPSAFDTDGDGLGDGDEVNDTLTDPTVADTDGDGLDDGTEVNDTLTDPNNADSDGDSFPDGQEVNDLGTDPLIAEVDADGDGLFAFQEADLGTDPNNPDTDGDGIDDATDLAPLDQYEWFNIDGVHDTREEIVANLVSIVEALTGEPVVIPDEGSQNQSDKSGRAHQREFDEGDVKVNPYEGRELRKGGSSKKSGKSDKSDKSDKSNKSDKSDKSGKSDKSDKSGKSDKSKKSNKVASKLFDTLTELSYNTNPDKWVTAVRPERKEGNDLFNTDRDAVKDLDDLLKDVDDPTADILQAAIDSLVSLDYQIAVISVDTAEAACGNSRACQRQVDRARKDIANGQKDVDKERWDKAITDFRKAWNRVAKYLPDAAGKGWVPSDDELLIEDEEPVIELPATFELRGNYPNPFNPTTTIEFDLPEAVNVQLTVFDALGRRVKTLVDGSLEAGTHSVRFDASQLPSGLYLYRIQAGQHHQVRSMMLIK